MIYPDSIKRIAAKIAQQQPTEPTGAVVGQFDLYYPTQDWAGMGYQHWMIVHDWTPGVGGGGNSHSGTGHTLDEAAADFVQGMGICDGGCTEFTMTEQDAIGRALEGEQFGREDYEGGADMGHLAQLEDSEGEGPQSPDKWPQRYKFPTQLGPLVLRGDAVMDTAVDSDMFYEFPDGRPGGIAIQIHEEGWQAWLYQDSPSNQMPSKVPQMIAQDWTLKGLFDTLSMTDAVAGGFV